MDTAQTETQMENFMKDYVFLIWLLWTIFTMAVGMIQINIQLCISSSHRDLDNFWPKWIS
jgi:hypothetical protein